jgi:hypothetical protein
MGWRALAGLPALDLDFAQPDRPGLVSAILSVCAPVGLNPPQIWGMSLAERIGALLSVWAATQPFPTDHLDLVFRCPAPGCQSDLEVAVPLSALQSMADEARNTPQMDVEDGLTLRRPTGVDQRNWCAAKPRDVQATILSDLIVAGQPTPDLDLDAALAEFDPLTCFSLSTRCPDCATESNLPVDLEAHVLGLLRSAQTRLFAQVDTLARRYGWTDTQIMAMPEARRARYIAIAKPEEGW